MTDQSRRVSPIKLVAAATVLGLAAGVAALYVKGTPSGNIADQACADIAGVTVTDVAGGAVAALRPASPPQSVAPMAFTGAGGQPASLADHQGKALLVNLWATWCVPCREEMPALDSLEQQRGDDRFEVVAINLDRGSEDKPKAFFADIGITALKLHRDPSLRLFEDAKKRGLALGLPATFLVDARGCLVAHMNGPADWAGPDALKVIDALKGG